MEYCEIITTTDDEKIADSIIDKLLEKRLISCAQKSEIKSKYYWKGTIEQSTEIKVCMKTKYSLYKEVELEIRKLHNYETPEIICIQIKDGYEEYLNWTNDETIK